MQKEIPPVFVAGIVIVMLGLIVFGAIKAMSPHERIVKTKSMGVTMSPIMQQRIAMLRQRAMATHAVTAAAAPH